MKILLTLSVSFILIAAFVLGERRYAKNPLSITPYPFEFRKDAYKNISADAPILIIGDRMGERLAKFIDLFTEKLSVNLSKPIKIISLSNEGDSIHRSLAKIKRLKRLPLIIIYLGGSDETYEKTFETNNLEIIQNNFELYQNDLIKSAMMVFPSLSRLIYTPVDYVHLNTKVDKDESQYSDPIFQLRMKAHYILYEAALDEFFKYIKKRNSLLIPITMPLNLDLAPSKSCYGSLTANADKELEELKTLIKEKDYKRAYNLAKDLALTNSTNADILYSYGQVLKKLNHFNQAKKYNELAMAYDCGNTRGNPIFNVILKRTAKRYNFDYFDFQQLLVDESRDNFVFLDDIYPQDVYMEKLVQGLAIKIKKRLKL